MVEQVKDLDKKLKDVVGRVAAGYSFAKDLANDLKKIESDEPDQAKKDVKKGFRLLRWIGRAERRINRDEKRIVVDLKELEEMGLPDDLEAEDEKVQEELHIMENKLIELASMFRGKLRDELKDIQLDEQLLSEYQDDPEKAKHLHEHVTALLKDSEKEVDDLITWMNGSQALFRRIKNFDEALKKIDPDS